MRKLIVATLLISGCGLGEKFEADANKISEDVQNAIDQSPEQQTFLEDHPDAQSAIGTWTYDANSMVLTLNIKTSDFGCEIESGSTFQMQLGALTDSTMTTLVGDNPDGEAQLWERIGSGSGIEGDWASADGAQSFLLTLSSDGSFILSMSGLNCGSGSDGQGKTGYYEEQNGCWVDVLQPATIIIDGAMDDWSDVAAISDPDNDSESGVSGDEIMAFYVADDGENLAWRISFADTVTTGIQPGGGSYSIGYETSNGLSSFRLRYEMGMMKFNVYDYPNGITYVVSNRDMEIKVPWESIGGKGQIYRTNVSVESDSGGAAPLDEGPCFAEANP